MSAVLPPLALLAARPAPSLEPARAALLLREARAHERAGRVNEAVETYASAVDAAEAGREGRVLSESLRRLGGMRRRMHDQEGALAFCRRALDVALECDDVVLAAEALNGIALVYLERGEWDRAREHFRRALSYGADDGGLRGRIEQNLGVMANIQGDFRAALSHYQRSLDAFRSASDHSGCATAYHNLGMISADHRQWDDAERYYRESLEIADSTGDVRLRALVLLNRTEVDLARQHYEDARRSAEQALQIFDQLGSRDGKSGAYRVLGSVYRETGMPVLAEARLKAAVELAADAGATVQEGEAARELALLYQVLGRNQDALRQLNQAHRLFKRLGAKADLRDIAAKTSQLESIYLEIVREWGRSIESSDSYTHGHSERVANYAIQVARALGWDEGELTTVRIGAYLHDLGKVRVPHEILNKPGRLTSEEFDLMKQHPVYGIEMLAAVEFPWDIKPMIRWHHEKLDGTGYPDRLRGDEIPVAAQVICVVDVFDALTTTRSYRGAMTHDVAMAEMMASKRWWRPETLDAFLGTVGKAGD